MEFDVLDLGRVAYRPCVEIQRDILEEVASGQRPSTLLFVEHDPVITLGANFHEDNLLLAEEEYAARGIEVVRTDRGGDVTYHGPGQLVAYPIFDLRFIRKDLHAWLRLLESAVIATLTEFGLVGGRNPVNTGVWVENRKICAIGIKVRRWVSMHGLALNCDVDLQPFGLIVPCGIRGEYGVTSIASETQTAASVEGTKRILIQSIRSHVREASGLNNP